MPIEYDGKAIDISFDPKYLVDMLQVLEPDDALTAGPDRRRQPGRCSAASRITRTW